jgi:murein DD-endopeptidase MepM/ murein hydrolase activator NlpD
MLLRLTTIAIGFLLWVPVAQAWSWPVQGPVLQTFSYDEAHPYAAGQHRGVDIGADATGDSVVAPAGGTITFAGSVPTSGKCVTIATPDGYSVTLTHLGSLAVAKGGVVAEGDVIGTVGPSGTPEESVPYVHLGIRSSADENGYLDPLGLLPALAPPPQGSTGSGSSGSVDSGSGSAAAPPPGPTPVSEPAPATVAPPSSGSGLVIRARPAAPPIARIRPRVARERRVRAARHPNAEAVTEPQTLRRPLEEPAHLRPAAPVATPQARPAPILLPLTLGAGPGVVAALAALATAFWRRRHRRVFSPAAVVAYPLRVVPPREDEMRRAA